VFVIEQPPALSAAAHVPAGLPLPVYPATGDSLAVHVVVAAFANLLTVTVAGEPCDIVVEPPLTVPEVQATFTPTDAGLPSEKVFDTVNVAVFAVFVTVHAPTARLALHDPAGVPLPV
jgi:hypothetical protein